jgi:translation initiation factor IF-2
MPDATRPDPDAPHPDPDAPHPGPDAPHPGPVPPCTSNPAHAHRDPRCRAHAHRDPRFWARDPRFWAQAPPRPRTRRHRDPRTRRHRDLRCRGPNREGSPTPGSRDPAIHSPPTPGPRDPADHSPQPRDRGIQLSTAPRPGLVAIAGVGGSGCRQPHPGAGTAGDQLQGPLEPPARLTNGPAARAAVRRGARPTGWGRPGGRGRRERRARGPLGGRWGRRRFPEW